AEASPEGDLLTARGWSEMIGPSGKALVSERVNIIQHPQGRPQELALRDNRIVDLVDAFVHYRADTQTGSSGSPVWSDSWDLVALHHASIGPLNEDEEIVTRDGSVWDFVDESDVDWEANEGVRISRIVEDLKIVSASWEPERCERIQACLGTPEFAELRVPGPFSPLVTPREPDAPPLPPPLSDPREEIPAEGLGALATWSDFDQRCSSR
ncbi:MAG: serine protease, partial [Pseudorhodobacter sp.]